MHIRRFAACHCASAAESAGSALAMVAEGSDQMYSFSLPISAPAHRMPVRSRAAIRLGSLRPHQGWHRAGRSPFLQSQCVPSITPVFSYGVKTCNPPLSSIQLGRWVEGVYLNLSLTGDDVQLYHYEKAPARVYSMHVYSLLG